MCRCRLRLVCFALAATTLLASSERNRAHTAAAAAATTIVSRALTVKTGISRNGDFVTCALDVKFFTCQHLQSFCMFCSDCSRSSSRLVCFCTLLLVGALCSPHDEASIRSADRRQSFSGLLGLHIRFGRSQYKLRRKRSRSIEIIFDKLRVDAQKLEKTFF